MNISNIQKMYYNSNKKYSLSSDEKIDTFYSSLSSAVEKSNTKASGKVLGLTMLPYNDRTSYGMSAYYSDESTPKDPVVKVSSNYGGEHRDYDVHVNEVDPNNASQLEMFALSSYLDDKGITDGGTFGSFCRMKAYGSNATDLGLFRDLQSPSNVTKKMDWVSMLKQMALVYMKNSETYKQYLDANNIATVLSKVNK